VGQHPGLYRTAEGYDRRGGLEGEKSQENDKRPYVTETDPRSGKVVTTLETAEYKKLFDYILSFVKRAPQIFTFGPKRENYL
jgi:hypothetical protein